MNIPLVRLSKKKISQSVYARSSQFIFFVILSIEFTRLFGQWPFHAESSHLSISLHRSNDFNCCCFAVDIFICLSSAGISVPKIQFFFHASASLSSCCLSNVYISFVNRNAYSFPSTHIASWLIIFKKYFHKHYRFFHWINPNCSNKCSNEY